MIEKILRGQLIILFLVSVIVSIAYFYADILPDNYFTITSETKSFNNFIYYITTFGVFIEYFSGSWVLLTFIIYAIAYSSILSKRNNIIDIFVPMTLSFMAVSFVSCFFSNHLGKGLAFLIIKLIPQLLSPIYLIGLVILNIYLIFNKNIFLLLFKGLKFIATYQRRMNSIETKKNVINTNANKKIRFLPNNIRRKFLNRITGFLRGNRKLDLKNDDNEIIQSPPQQQSLDITHQIDNIAESTKLISVNDKMNESIKSDIKKLSPDNDKKYYQIVKTIGSAKDKSKNISPDEKYFEEIIDRIEEKLNEFKIEGQVINILKGPVVDTFELELGAGVKVSKITSSSEDLSMALYGAPIRIVYPMRGKTTVGIEVPRNPREIIYLDELLTSKDFQKTKFDLPLAIGKDAFGESFVVDLAAMPHMLVAGSTGSGKSVFINSLLVSLLIKKSPDQMKLILIDPKQLELSLYSELPHLLLPVVTEAKTASLALQWAVKEMDRRYSIMKEFQVRNLKGFNDKLKNATPEMLSKISKYYDVTNGQVVFDLASIVIIVDEFADLILTKAGKEIESNICRLAGKARAAGIHMVVATQRPSVDVITGLIKSNFPTRVSFRVTTSIDSRTILNAIGAEKLLGKGDMLYKSGVETIRVHSSFVDEDEIEALTSKLSQIKPDFCLDAIDFIENGGENSNQDPYAYGSHISNKENNFGDDSLFEEAVNVVMEYRAASASMLQRRLKIGYNRAANLIDQLEEKGIIGPAQGSKPRKVIGGSEQSV